MPSKILTLLLIITSLFGYLEWGGHHHVYLFEAEVDIIGKLVTHPIEAIHPFTIVPLIGQLLLGFTLFQKTVSKRLTYFGLAGLAPLLLFMFVIGLLGRNYKILLSTLPFISVMLLALVQLRKHKKSQTT